MMREDKAEAAAIDAELDARDAAREAARAARPRRVGRPRRRPGRGHGRRTAPPEYDAVTPEADDADDDERPWWESDPRITNRYVGLAAAVSRRCHR